MLETITFTREWAEKAVLGIPLYDALYRYVCPGGEEEKADENYDDVENETTNAPDSPVGDISFAVVNPPYAYVRDAPEYESKEGIEEGA